LQYTANIFYSTDKGYRNFSSLTIRLYFWWDLAKQSTHEFEQGPYTNEKRTV